MNVIGSEIASVDGRGSRALANINDDMNFLVGLAHLGSRLAVVREGRAIENERDGEGRNSVSGRMRIREQRSEREIDTTRFNIDTGISSSTYNASPIGITAPGSAFEERGLCDGLRNSERVGFRLSVVDSDGEEFADT